MAQLDYILTSPTILGDWVIKVQNALGAQESSITYQVAEYVLPKFKVSIAIPPFVLRTDPNIPVKICASYTYGEPVNGILYFNATYVVYPWENPNGVPRFQKTLKITGCIDIVIGIDDLQWSNYMYYYRSVLLYAQVIEDGTGVLQNSKKSFDIARERLLLSFPDSDPFYKPSLPYYGVVSVLNPDGSPRPNKVIQVCYNSIICRDLTSDKTGAVIFTLVPDSNSTSGIIITATAINYKPVFNGPNQVYGVPTVYSPTPAQQFFSPSNSYIQIERKFRDIHCEEDLFCIKIYSNKLLSPWDLKFEGVSRERVIPYFDVSFDGSTGLEYLYRDSTFINKKLPAQEKIQTLIYTVRIPPEVFPTLHLTVYYIRTDGEMVATWLDIDVSNCLPNNAKLQFSSPKVRPGSDVGVTVLGSPFSICGITALDESVLLLASENSLTPQTIYKIINNYDYESREDLRSVCWITTPGVHSSSQTVPPWWIRDPVYSSSKGDSANAIQGGHIVMMTGYVIHTKPCTDIFYPPFPEPPRSSFEPTVGQPQTTLAPGPPTAPPPTGPSIQVRDDLRETWLWRIVQLESDGLYKFNSTIPETISTFDGRTICLSAEDGIGISAVASITTFKPLFISLELPYSIIRGEISLVVASVFNYLSQDVPVVVELLASTQYEIKSSSSQVEVCLGSNTIHTVDFLVKPTALGKINVSALVVSAKDSSACLNESFSGDIEGDQIVQPLLVKLEGVPRTDVVNLHLCTDNVTHDFDAVIDVVLPALFVNDSVSGAVSVWGDDLGNSLDKIGTLVGQPDGCGEQNMIYMAPDLFIYTYLLVTNKLTPEFQNTLLGYISSGYQRELAFRRDDYSFSAFGQSDISGSIWLTSFVLKIFYHAQAYVYIDWSDMLHSANWILTKQLPDGCFPQVGFVIHKELEGGESDSSITGYVLASLLEANAISETQARKGFQCLSDTANPSVYLLALMSYAESLAEFPTGTDFFDILLTNAIFEGNLAFYNTGTPSVDVEIAAYTVLCYMIRLGANGLAPAGPFVRWLYTQASPYGGFLTTQDTVMAIQAIALCAQYSGSSSNIDITIVDTDGSQTLNFHINQNEILEVQSEQLPVVPTVLEVSGNGTGCVFIQAKVTYNVAEPSPNASFEVDVKAHRGVGDDCKKAVVKICFRYLGSGDFTQMVLIELRPISGFVVDLNSITPLLSNPRLHLKKVEDDTDRDTIVFYFDYVSAQRTCFVIILKETIEVQHLKPGTVVIYSYYNTVLNQKTEYTIGDQCSPENITTEAQSSNTYTQTQTSSTHTQTESTGSVTSTVHNITETGPTISPTTSSPKMPTPSPSPNTTPSEPTQTQLPTTKKGNSTDTCTSVTNPHSPSITLPSTFPP